jgi:hypothetical protein
VRTSTYDKNSFKYAAAVLWNDLPDDFRKIYNFNQFKNILKSWNGNVLINKLYLESAWLKQHTT